MSASLSAKRGGQPSTTQPMAGPWLSPKVVTLNKCPNVLNDMGERLVAARGALDRRQTASPAYTRSHTPAYTAGLVLHRGHPVRRAAKASRMRNPANEICLPFTSHSSR